MIVTLYNREVVICDEGGKESYAFSKEYKVEKYGVLSGIYQCDVSVDGEDIFTLRTNNLCIVDKRIKK